MMNPNGGTTTTTLAESLLMDLDDLSDDEEEEIEEEAEAEETGEKVEKKESKSGAVVTVPVVRVSNSDDNVNFHELTGLHLLEDKNWKSHRSEIKRLLNTNTNTNTNSEEMNVKVNFDMLIESTPYLSLLDNEMLRAHDELVHSYGKQYFPELSDLIVDPKQYYQVVTILFREETLETISSPRISEELSHILTSNQFLTVSVAASTSTTTQQQQSQDQHQKDIIQFILHYVQQLLQCIQDLLNFVERGMQQYAPNVTILVGSAKCAAKLIGAAGGLEELCQMPACNLQLLGRSSSNHANRANTNTTQQGSGSILWNYCDLILNCRPKSLQPKICKQVANKLALAARCDLSNTTKSNNNTTTINNSQGLKFRQMIQDKYQKLQEPDKAPVVKALPKPDLETKKRRGGKRMRRLKERFEETEFMKQVNRRVFSASTGEYGDDAMGLTLGMLESSGSNNGIVQRSKKKLRKANTKASRKAQLQQQQYANSSNNPLQNNLNSGLASSMVFTPVQGLELVNPNAQQNRVREANQKWFSENPAQI